MGDLTGTHPPLVEAANKIDSALAGRELAVTKYLVHRENKFLADYHELDKVVDQALARATKLVQAD